MEAPKEESSCPRLLPSAAQMQKINKTGGSKSPECIHHIASQVTCRCRSVQLKEAWYPQNLKSLKSPPPSWWKWVCLCEGGAQARSWGSVWGPISGERRWHCFQSVQKYLPDYCWNMNPAPYFCTFSVCFTSELKFCNIASSLILLIFHLLLVFHLF